VRLPGRQSATKHILMNNDRTCLVVIYNHHHQKNIPVVRRIYRDRFSRVVQLMPFYTGDDPDVIRVFGNSFQFHAYIAQVRRELQAVPCDRYLFIGDDLVLNPRINESTLASLMQLDGDKCFFSEMHDVSRGVFVRGTMEAHNFGLLPQGIDRSALHGIPSYDEAFAILNRKGLMTSTRLARIQPTMQLFESPWSVNWYKNYKIFRGRLWHLREALKYRLKAKTASYPVVFGYSDIFSIPRVYAEGFFDYLEIFASIRMFVELAIPTTLALHDWPMVQEKDLALKPLNLWFPPDPRLFKQKEQIINQFASMANFRIDGLKQAFPRDYLYMHPVKLSQWT